jgi:hypothetical protein
VPNPAVTLWLRTNALPQPSDVGCEVRGTAGTSTLTLRGAPAATSQSLPFAFQSTWIVTATFSPSVSGRANVRCEARQGWGGGTGTYAVDASISLPPGYAGMGIEGATLTAYGLWILDRDDLPAL